MEKQLLLFETPKRENEDLFKYIAELKESHRKTQKRLFGEINDINKRLIETQGKVDLALFYMGVNGEAVAQKKEM